MSNKVKLIVEAEDQATPIISKTKSAVGSLNDEATQAAKGGITQLGTATDKLTGFLSTALSTATGFLATQVFTKLSGEALDFAKSSSRASKEYERSMIALEVVATKLGESATKAKDSAATLGKELRIGAGQAAASLQNLMNGGLGLDQATELMKRFTNEAMTGKSPTLTLGQAVENLSFAFMTESSELGNLSGISQNYSYILEKGAEKMGKNISQLNESERAQAKYQGLLEITNITLGSAEKFTGSLIDKEAEFDNKLQDLKVSIGNGINPVLASLYDAVSELGVFEDVTNWVQGLIGKQGEFTESGESMLRTVGDIYLGILDFGKAVLIFTGTISETGKTLTLLVGSIVYSLQTINTKVAEVLNMVGLVSDAEVQRLKDINTTGKNALQDLATEIEKNHNNLIGKIAEIDNKKATIQMKLDTAPATASLTELTGSISSVKPKLVVSADVSQVRQSINSALGALGKAGAISSIPKFASGVTNFGGGYAIVGEEGPELTYLPKGSNIINHKETQEIFKQSQPVNITNYITGSDFDIDSFVSRLSFQLRTII